MTLLDIERIEQELSVKVPMDFRNLLLEYPFGEDSCGAYCMVFNDPDLIIEANRGLSLHFMLHHRSGRWTPGKEHLAIGSDGGEMEYYLDLSSAECNILEFDLETGELVHFAKGIDNFVRKIQEIDRELLEDARRWEERRKNAKWWEFWKYL